MARNDCAGGRWRRRLLLAGFSLAVLAGCGSGTYPVKGTLVFDDNKPATELAGGFVTFQSTDQNVSAQGSIQRDGTFVLSTSRPNDGAFPGVYKVLVTPPPYRGSESGPAQAPLLDLRYSDLAKSGLTVTIEPKRNDVILKLQRRRP